MGVKQFRITKPIRTYSGKELTDYKGYKKFLVNDFHERCGYTDCSHFWFGGKTTFQIDHFRPKSIYPALETKYLNLVYSCSYVNRAKSIDDSVNYIDPCDVDYNLHFYRDELGNIFPFKKSDAAQYMYKKLKLYLKRYSIIWMLEQLTEKKELLKKHIQESGNQDAKDLYLELDYMFMDYIKYLKAEQ